MNKTISILFSILFISSCATVNKPETAWKSLIKTDLEFIYKTIKENHPGPIDKLNPEFNVWLEEGKRKATSEIDKANSLESYHFILSKYIAGFNDGHLNFGINYEATSLKWPKFVVSYRNGKYIIFHSEISEVLKNDELISCDQKTIPDLYSSLIYPYLGNPQPRSKLYSLAPQLFVDVRNPFVVPPQSCNFKRAGKEFTHNLTYNYKNRKALTNLTTQATFGPRGDFAYRKIGKNKYWISLPTFGPNKEQTQLMKNYINRVKKLSSSHSTIVFDVRGNRGGSSFWGDLFIKSLYGPENFKRVEQYTRGRVYIDWRVSPENSKSVAKWPTTFTKRFGEKNELTLWAKTFSDQLKDALKEGKTTVRQKPGKVISPIRKKLSLVSDHSFKGKIFFLTDGRCGSACLDFADVTLALPNAVHVGLETAADTVYMEINTINPLPSQLAHLSYPMKVWRNRPRGNRESYKPEYTWKGEISDTKSLEKWIFNKLAKETQ